MTYSQIDRIIVGGVMPVSRPVGFAPELGRHTGTDFFLERRELGLINVGGDARVTVDGEVFLIAAREALYIGRGARAIEFSSVDATKPAKLYFNCAPAHAAYPHRKVTLAEASPETLGSAASSNRRTIYKFLVPDVQPTCQLLMGHDAAGARQPVEHHALPHTHDRRMEVYFYFDMARRRGGLPHPGRTDGNAPRGGAQ